MKQLLRAVAGLVVVVTGLAACSPDSGEPATTSSATTTTARSFATTTAAPTTTTVLPRTTNVLVIGDFGDGSDRQRTVASAMEEYAAATPIDALVTTGDNLYTDDVADAWEEPFGWVSRMGIPIFAAWGNHDLESPSRREAVAAALKPPGRWYRAALGDATLVVLDANQVENPDQTVWLESVLTDSGDGPLIVSFHQPAFSCAKHESTPAVVSAWVPLFEAHGVDLVLNGHDHDYQRFEQNGVTYVVTGGGGRKLYRIGRCPGGTPRPVVGDDVHHHFMVLHIGPAGIAAEALTPDGRSIDRFLLP